MSKLELIRKRWSLPKNYLEYLKNNKKNKRIENVNFVNCLELYGSDTLIKSQEGYSYNPIEKQAVEGWPEEYVVIADDGADPYVLDLSKSDGEDAPVLSAMHGTGSWNFSVYADSFEEFLNKIHSDENEFPL